MKELVISANNGGADIAILEEGKLVELHKQQDSQQFAVGDVYLGYVSKLLPNLNAAFVQIGHEKEAFIHYTDLGPKLPCVARYTRNILDGKQKSHELKGFDISTEINKNDKIAKALKRKDPLMVQILKEPISTKGPRLTAEITIPGRLLVLVPFSNEISISKKIEDEKERSRLDNLLSSVRPVNFGLIARTAATGKTVAPLHEEIMDLMSKWEDLYRKAKASKPPAILLSEEDKTKTILRDIITPDFTKISVNTKDLERSVTTYLSENIPELQNIVSLHKGGRSIFQEYGVTHQIMSSFGKNYTMESGAYLVIEHTEAMHVIDVNSGPKMSKSNTDNAAYEVNVESAKEIARQLRLRDIGGLIIIDFIDMKKIEHRNGVLQAMKDHMDKDRAQHTILPLSKFGLMQITRQRTRPELVINTTEVCPTCNGTGTSRSTLNLIEDIERDMSYIFKATPNIKLDLFVHPFINAYLKKGGIKNFRWKWYSKFKRWIRIVEDSNLGMVDYKFFDGTGEEIRLD